ncbi:aldolase/citrate lyase family protein [Pedobacter sp.]|uniref:aldolase/citrate lyase family protein n=1 Tax=Pedobacter sp. TaxID=1411316 RepID=UPI00396C6959
MEFLIIENTPERAQIYDKIGVERIFIDLETLGKTERQGHLDTVISLHHSIADISKVKAVLNKSLLLVRTNPIHSGSQKEIDQIVNEGADIVMLPYFKTVQEVQKFIKIVNKRAKVCLLIETPEALVRIDDILAVEGIDEVHIGLNDLHLGLNLQFMFELLSCGLVDYMVQKIKQKKIRFGIGGIASLSGGKISGKEVLAEHVRLGSSMVILSRTFVKQFDNDIENLEKEINAIRSQEIKYNTLNQIELEQHHIQFKQKINQIVNKLIGPFS